MVQRLRPGQSQRCLVHRRCLPQQIPGWDFLGRLRRRLLLYEVCPYSDQAHWLRRDSEPSCCRATRRPGQTSDSLWTLMIYWGTTQIEITNSIISNDLSCLLMQTWTLAPLTPCMKECFFVIRLQVERSSSYSFTAGIDMHLLCPHQGPTALQHHILLFFYKLGISPHQIESRHFFSFLFFFNRSYNQLREVFSSSMTTTHTFFLCEAFALYVLCWRMYRTVVCRLKTHLHFLLCFMWSKCIPDQLLK